MKTTPREGDYVKTEILNHELIHKIIYSLVAYAGPFDDPRIGWVGVGASHKDLFKCERCGVENLDCWEIEHKEDCSAKLLLDILAELKSFKNGELSLSDLLGDDEPAWSGEGLPPVGAIIAIGKEYRNAGDQLKVIAHDGGGAVCRFLSGDRIGSLGDFLPKEICPLKSEREIAIEEMENIRKEWVKNSHSTPDLFGMLYDKGFRKVEK